MSAFTDPIRIHQDPDDPKFWITDAVHRYHVGSEDSDEVITVPEGFRTDFQSIPPLLWSVFGHPLDAYAASGLFHDFLYQYPGDGVEEDRSWGCCDNVYEEMNDVLKCPWWKRMGKWLGVRGFGWRAWNRYRAEERARKVARIMAYLHDERQQ